MTGVGDMSDPADERYEVPCPDCSGSGGEVDGRTGHTVGECERCDGDGSCWVDADEIVTVGCRFCSGSGEHWPVGGFAGDGPTTCTACDGDGEVTGWADEVCT